MLYFSYVVTAILIISLLIKTYVDVRNSQDLKHLLKDSHSFKTLVAMDVLNRSVKRNFIFRAMPVVIIIAIFYYTLWR